MQLAAAAPCTTSGHTPPSDRFAQIDYLRSRYYMPTTGRFASIDPFGGQANQPQSLHKYLYAHANPVMGTDPLGLFFTYIGQLSVASIKSIARSPRLIAIGKAYDTAETLTDAITLVSQFAATGTVNPMILAGLLTTILPFGSLLEKGVISGKKLVGATDSLTDALKGFKRTGGKIDDKAVELVGELAAIGTARKLGYEAIENFPTRYHGFDGIFRNPAGGYVIVEAKGGASKLGKTAAGGQLSQDWIKNQIKKLSNKNKKWGQELESALQNNQISALLVSTPVDKAAETVSDPSFVYKTWNQIGSSSF